MEAKYLSPEQVELIYPGITRKRLERWRWAKTGPAYSKVGRQILYGVEDLERFVTALRVDNHVAG